MNRRVRVWVGSVLGCALIWRAAGFGLGSDARGQSATAAPAAPAGPTAAAITAQATAAVVGLLPLQTSATVSPGQQSRTIAPFIAKQLTALAAPDVAGSVAVARQALVLGCPRLGTVTGTSTPPYAAAYSTELSLAGIKLLSGANTSAAVKINLGIVAERVANNGQSIQLLPLVQKLLADRSDPVVYWGCKAARPMVVATVLQPGFNGKTTLFRAVVNAVSQHPNGDMGGLIAAEAYRALVINPNNVPATPAATMKPLLKPLYDPVLDLLELRTALYAKGVVPSPDAEANVPTFLTTSTPPPIYTDAQKARAVQDLVNLLDMAGQRAATVTTPQQLGQLRPTLQNAASALDVFSQTGLLSKVVQMPLGANGPTIAALCATVEPAMSGPFPYLKRPPTLPPLPPPVDATGQPAAAAPKP